MEVIIHFTLCNIINNYVTSLFSDICSVRDANRYASNDLTGAKECPFCTDNDSL